MKINIVFMGTPEFSVPVLENLIKNFNVIGVVTQPDRLQKNGNIIYSPVKEVALKNNIRILQPEKVRKEYEAIIDLKPDMIVTCAYGQIIPKILLDSPKYGCINIHASLLPKLRGGAPIHHAIIDGYKETGITIMYMNEKMDEGDIIVQEKTLISATDTTGDLHDRLSEIGSRLIIDTIPKIVNNQIKRIKQDDNDATYGYVIKREDEKIDFNDSKENIYNQIRGLNSWPGAYCLFNEKVLKVWESRIGLNSYEDVINGQIVKIYNDGFGVKVNDGEIIFTVIQPDGKKKMDVSSFINGYKGNLLEEVLK